MMTIHPRPAPAGARSGPAVFALLLGAAFMAGCAEVPPHDAPEAAETPETSDAWPADPNPKPGAIHAAAVLNPQNASGVMGEVTAMHTVDAVVVVVELAGLPEPGEYGSHIHAGRCLEGGPVAVALNPVIGLEDGTGASTTTLELAEISSDQPLFAQVHGLGSAPLACGDLQVGASAEIEVGQASADPLQVDRASRSITLPATVQAESFRTSSSPDHRYHAVVHEGGSAIGKALFSTTVPDGEVARILRELGAEDGGGVPMAAWNLRRVPLLPQPGSRVGGTRVETRVHWAGAPREYDLHELLDDPGGRGVEMRFGGNEEQDHLWDSGCILCLFSCPGGVVSNAAYSIRDHQREVTAFAPGDLLPPDGTPVTITLTLVPG